MKLNYDVSCNRTVLIINVSDFETLSTPIKPSGTLFTLKLGIKRKIRSLGKYLKPKVSTKRLKVKCFKENVSSKMFRAKYFK